MPLILVAGAAAGSGATTVAVGLAHRLAAAGRSVRLERLVGDTRAGGDAAVFGALEFAAASGAPVEVATITTIADVPGAVTIVEAPIGADAASLARQLGARLLLVGRLADRAAGASPAGATFVENRAAGGAGALRLPEDRLLAAPTVARLIEASGAAVLSRSLEGEAAVCEHLVIGAISHDAADAYFRRFPRRAVITRAEKVDVALAAMLTGSECLILTGGHEPSPYLLDRAASTRQTTLLLAPGGTVETMRDLEGTFGTAAFSGEAKVARAGELMRAVLDDAVLATLIA